MEKLEPLKLNDQIAQHLIDMIVNGEVAPEQRLPSERSLASSLGVSRGTLRQTLVRLELDGILDIKPGSGVFVTADGLSRAYARPTPHSADVPPLDIIKARRIVEGEAALHAALNASDGDLVRISNLLTDFSAGPRRYDLRHPSDRDFHIAIAEASGNRAVARLVVELWEMQRGKLYQRLEDHFSTAPMRDLAVEDHRKIIEALLKRDAQGARQAMHDHLDRIHLNLATGELHPDTVKGNGPK